MHIGDVSAGTPYPLGATIDRQGVNFAIFSRHATQIDLCLFDEAGDELRVQMQNKTDDVWHVRLDHVQPGQLYGYRVHGPQNPEQGHWFNPAKLLIDPYARELVGKLDWSGPLWFYEQRGGKATSTICHRDNAYAMPKCRVVNIPIGSPSLARPNISRAETIIYEMHPRGMTMLHPDIAEQHRGKISGLTEPPIISHLKNLGITSVELLPIQAAIDEHHLVKLGLTNYWRYNTIGFFAPEPHYVSDNGLAEIKTMVERFHEAGIEVILDVVFNHTAEGDHNGPMLSFKGIDNRSYYHLRPESRQYYDNHTGCGNALNLSEPRVLQMVLDCLRFWAGRIGVDGFRFDLATTLGRGSNGFDHDSHFFAVLRQDPILAQIKLIAEPWDVGPGGYQLGGFPSPFIEWNDRYRDAVRRFWRSEEAMLPNLATRMLGSVDVFGPGGRRPQASVNFLTAHDGFTLLDLVSFDDKHNEANGEGNRDGHSANFSLNHGHEGPTSDLAIQKARIRQKMNLMATLLLSQGTPMLLAGDELGNSQNGNNNAYCQDNEIGWVHWPKEPDSDVFQGFVRWLIAFRRQNPLLRSTHYFHGHVSSNQHQNKATWLCPNGQAMTDDHWHVDWAKSIGLLLSEDEHQAQTKQFHAFSSDCLLIALNASHDDVAFHTPATQGTRRWKLCIDTAAATGRPERLTLTETGGSFTVPGRSLQVLAGEKVSDDDHQRERGVAQNSLDRLAMLYGIEPSYHDAFGVRHDVTDGTKRTLLTSMGIEAATEADDLNALEAVEIRRCQRILKPVTIARQGSSLRIEIVLPAATMSKRFRWLIETENGKQHRGEGHPNEQIAGDSRVVDGKIWRIFILETGLRLRLGYHRFCFETSGDQSATSTIIVVPRRAFSSGDLKNPRRHWGLLAPLYGLRSARGGKIGDLIDLGLLAETLAKEGAAFIGINPINALNPTFPHQASPYSPSSRLHLNELLTGLEIDGRHLARSDDDETSDLVDYAEVGKVTLSGLKQHYLEMVEKSGEEARLFQHFSAERGQALEDFARFRTLFDHFYQRDPGTCWTWRHWPKAYQDPNSEEVRAFAGENRDRINFFSYVQYLADCQLGDAQKKALASNMPIGLYLDLAVGVDPHGADCWVNAKGFASGASLGAPPDAFNPNGQNWALAPFQPHRLVDDAYRPFIDLLRSSMRHAGALRIDHIIGLQRSFWIPDQDDLGGAYVRYPIDDLLGIIALESHRHRCLVIGEDLGNLPEGLRERLDSHHILSSRVMFFEQDHEQEYCSSNSYPDQALATVGTHDLPTLAGFWQGRDIDIRTSLRIDGEQESVAWKQNRKADQYALLRRLDEEGLLPPDIHPMLPPLELTPALLAAIHAYLAKSSSELVAVQLEDALGLIEQANLPGTVDEYPNWQRRMPHRIEDLGTIPAARAIFDIMAKLRPGHEA